MCRLIALHWLPGGIHELHGKKLLTTEASSVSSLCECLTALCFFLATLIPICSIQTSLVNRQEMPFAQWYQFLNNLQLPFFLGMRPVGTQPLHYEEAKQSHE